MDVLMDRVQLSLCVRRLLLLATGLLLVYIAYDTQRVDAARGQVDQSPSVDSGEHAEVAWVD